MTPSRPPGSLPKSNPSTIRDKFLVGYQGWFTCPGDGEPLQPGHHGFSRWFSKSIQEGGNPTVDYWPETSEYTPAELYEAPGLTKGSSNEPTRVFSSRNRATVVRHFRWMAEAAVDGVFLQRNLFDCDMEKMGPAYRHLRDEVGDRVREAAEAEGRVFAYMYDVTNVDSARVLHVIEEDWKHLVGVKGILNSPSYLRERARPVVAVRGLGTSKSGHTPELVHRLAQFFRQSTPGGVYLIAGTPAHWRTSNNDADPNPALVNVYLDNFDMISPWTVRQYVTLKEVDQFSETVVKGDVELLGRRNQDGTSSKVDYMPVVFPGYSAHNMYRGRRPLNEIPRHGGKFLWQQIFNVKRLGARVVFGAMWDQYDDGTALLPIVEKSRNLPKSAQNFRFLALDDDGFDLTNDWYIRVCGYAAEGMRGERRIFESFPSKELQDFWGARPKYIQEEPSVQALSSSSAGFTQWAASQPENADEPPPPPYSLESAPSVAQASGSARVPSRAPSPDPIGVLSVLPSSASSSMTSVPTTNVGHSSPYGNEVEQMTHSFGAQHITPSEQLPPAIQGYPTHHLSASPPPVGGFRPNLSPSPSFQGSRPQLSPSPSLSATRPSLSPSPSLSATRPPMHPAHTGSSGSFTSGRPPTSPSPNAQQFGTPSFQPGQIVNHTSFSVPHFPVAYASAGPTASHTDPTSSQSSYGPSSPAPYPPSASPASRPHEASPYQSSYFTPAPSANRPHEASPYQSSYPVPAPSGSASYPQQETGSSHHQHNTSVIAGKRPQAQGSQSQWPPSELNVHNVQRPSTFSPPLPTSQRPGASPPGSMSYPQGPTGYSGYPASPPPHGNSEYPASPQFQGNSGYPTTPSLHGNSNYPSSPSPTNYPASPPSHGNSSYPASPPPSGYTGFPSSQGSTGNSTQHSSSGPFNQHRPDYSSSPASSGFPQQPHHGQAGGHYKAPSPHSSGEWRPPVGAAQTQTQYSTPSQASHARAPTPPYGGSHPTPSSHGSYPMPPGAGRSSQYPHHAPAPGHHDAHGSNYHQANRPGASPPPSLPPRPGNSSYNPGGSSRPLQNTQPGGIALPGFAASAIDKYAGHKQRDRKSVV